MINSVLTMSLTGSAVVLACLLADKLAGKRLSAVWHDRILRLALVFMLVPIGAIWEAASKAAFAAFFTGHTVQVPNVMQIAPAITPDNALAVVPAVIPEVPPVVQAAPVTVSVDVFRLLTLVWAVGAMAALCWKVWSYVRFRKLLGGERRPLSVEEMEVLTACKRELDVRNRVEAAVMPGVSTPMVTGLFRPVILLPDVPLSEEELHYLFLHELTHIKRRDLWVRFFALWGVVLHWYNPFMHLLDRKLKQSSEQSCDERVAQPMSREERLAYGGMLLKLAAEPGLGANAWAVTLSTRESIQRRLGSIVKAGRWTRADKIVALVTVLGLLCCGAVVACSMQEPLAVENPTKETVQKDVVPDPVPDQQPNQEKQERKLPEVARYGYAQAVMAVDWASFKTKITKPETQALEKYLPVLEGEEFTWLAEDGQTRTNIQGLLDSMFGASGNVSEVAYVEAVLFADMFQSGEENLCVLLPHLGYYWIIFHEENGVFYAIDMPVRWFGSVQKDGLYAGSGGAAHHYYHRISFENGNYTVADIAEVHDNVLFIAGEEKSTAEYEMWKKANLKEEAPWYAPSGAKYGSEREQDDLEVQFTPEPEPTETEEPSGLTQSERPLVQPVDGIITIGGINYETYVDNLGITRLKNSVGNPDGLYITDLLALDTLVDGKYPINRRGETYGLEELADYVGETPLLIAVSSLDENWKVQDGYLWWEDYYADFSDPAVASRYEAYSSDANWLNVPYEEPVSGWFVPLYDAEHEQIGVCSMEYSVPRWESGEIRSLEDSAKKTEGEPESTTIRTDEMEEPIAMPEGAIIIDGVAYPRPANNHGIAVIYDADGGLAPHQQAVLDSLPNGTYPKNSRGEYYGSDEVSSWLNIEPDLILATGTEGQEGYVWWEDAKIRFACLDDIEKVIWNENGYLIPLYDSEHNQIGWKQEETPIYNVQGDYVQITKETVDVLRSLVS